MGVKTVANQDANPDVMVAVMGATGTGKSTFIHQLTADKDIRIGHRQQSETFDIQTARYVDGRTGLSVMLIDTPGFNDSRESVTDTDILEKIVGFLEPEGGERRKLNGIIYMHRISDPRLEGVSRKNLRMFHSLCGDDNLKNVRIVTTNWGRVGEKEGDDREEDLRTGGFKALLSAKAAMRRHLNTVESARAIMSELVPLKAVTMQIQQELAEGRKLEDTAAGSVLTEAMQIMQERHEKELANLNKEIDAVKANNLALREQLADERSVLEEKMARAKEDRQRLSRNLEETRKDLAAARSNFQDLQRQTEEELVALKRAQEQTRIEKEQLAGEIKNAEERLKELEARQPEAVERKLGDDERKAKRENELLTQQLAVEREQKLQEARANQSALKQRVDEMRRKLTEYEMEIAGVEETERQLKVAADHGMFRRFPGVDKVMSGGSGSFIKKLMKFMAPTSKRVLLTSSG